MQVGFVSQTNCRSFPACIVFLFQMSQRQRSFNANLRIYTQVLMRIARIGKHLHVIQHLADLPNNKISYCIKIDLVQSFL
ncbi:CBM_collapsed_G0048840.mRNA.1.CDS.1 [Saccharomyces cerevisiae]|nr:CBM_collapsed_G0048840.mRNA.1.CDS.1 [Saccharomyces cerevisiae]